MPSVAALGQVRQAFGWDTLLGDRDQATVRQGDRFACGNPVKFVIADCFVRLNQWTTRASRATGPGPLLTIEMVCLPEIRPVISQTFC